MRQLFFSAVLMVSNSLYASDGSNITSILKEEFFPFEQDAKKIPTPLPMVISDVMESFTGPIHKNGREWSLARFDDNEELKTIINGQHFFLRPLNEGNSFFIEPFEVDRAGELRYTLCLVSDNNSLDAEGFPDQLPFFFSTHLTESEMSNRLVKRFILPFTFEEIAKGYRQKNATLIEKVALLRTSNLIFLMKKQSDKEEALQAFRAEMGL